MSISNDLGFYLGLTLYLLGFIFFAYSCILADPAKSPSAHYCTVELPSRIRNKATQLCGPLGGDRIEGIVTFVQLVGDWGLVIVYLGVVLGSWSVVLTEGFDVITHSPYVSNIHQYVAIVVFGLCMTSWRKAMTTPPGCITAKTMGKFDHYPYDNLLFTERHCPTVGIRKLPRSKFDRATMRHVPRFDHYCGWLRNTIGEENYRWFLLFLLVHVGMCFYGTVVLGRCFYGEIVDMDLLNATFYLASTGQEVQASKVVVVQYLMARHFGLAGTFLIMTVMGFVLALFLGFHLYITARGMTTNEWYKWRTVRRWHTEAKREYDAAIREGRPVDESVANIALVDRQEADVQCTGPTNSNGHGENMQDKQEEDKGPGECCEEEADAETVSNPGPFPSNIYDRGICENFAEVIWPRSLRPDAIDRWRETYAEEMRKEETSRSKSAEPKGKEKAI